MRIIKRTHFSAWWGKGGIPRTKMTVKRVQRFAALPDEQESPSVICISQLNCHGNRGVLAHLIYLCRHSQNKVLLLAAVCVFWLRCLTACKLCEDRCSHIDIYCNRVADCKHQVTSMHEASSVCYSILFNHRGREFTGCWWHSFLPAGDGGGCREETISGLTSLHAEVFLRAVTGRALLIRGPVVDVTLCFWPVMCGCFPLFFPRY